MGIYNLYNQSVVQRSNTMSKLAIIAAIAAVIGVHSLIPADCQADNGKRFDNCQIIDGKEVFTKN